ncbi:MAG: RNA polymerase subunit sigma [Sphingopyxis sp.]|nr:MAG: RNA polymerase subunit sigma [Sphingopyxis sp.]
MTESTTTHIPSLLTKWQSGDVAARDHLFDLLYVELRKISASLLKGEGDISLTTGDLVNEAVMRVVGSDSIAINDRAHFLSLAALTMRRVLTDRARKNGSDKRHHYKVTLATEMIDMPDHVDIYQLEDALDKLALIDADRAKIVEMRYYGGMSIEETARALGVSESSVKRSWRVSRAWLLEALSG